VYMLVFIGTIIVALPYFVRIWGKTYVMDAKITDMNRFGGFSDVI
jgi:hypothetical protein